jgi:hypothetical protein
MKRREFIIFTADLARHCRRSDRIAALPRVRLLHLLTTGYEFAFVMQPLKLQGATGSTVAPTPIR